MGFFQRFLTDTSIDSETLLCLSGQLQAALHGMSLRARVRGKRARAIHAAPGIQAARPVKPQALFGAGPVRRGALKTCVS